MGSVATPQRRLYLLDAGFSEHRPFRGRILTCATDGSDLRTLIPDLATLPDGITIDREAGHFYWTNMGTDFKTHSGSVERADLADGGNRTVVVPPGTKGVFTPKQIVLTRRDKKLYWCDREGMKVMRANRDGSGVEVLVSTGDEADEAHRRDLTRWCVGVAVDEARGWFYWTQKGPSKGGQGRIFRARIDGPPAGPSPSSSFDPAARPDVQVVHDHLPEPIDLELDEASQTLYWTDRGDPPLGNTLNRAAVGLGGEPQVLAIRMHETIGVALDREADVAYVTDLAGGLYAVDIKTRKKTVLFSELGDLTGIALL